MSYSGVRILDGPMTDSLEAMAFNMKDQVNDIYSCSWGPDDNGKTVDGPHQLAQVCSDVHEIHWQNKDIVTLIIIILYYFEMLLSVL